MAWDSYKVTWVYVCVFFVFFCFYLWSIFVRSLQVIYVRAHSFNFQCFDWFTQYALKHQFTGDMFVSDSKSCRQIHFWSQLHNQE